MYPFAIINNFGAKIERAYRDFAQRVNNKILPQMNTDEHRWDGIINDAANVLELLEEIRLNYGDYVDDALLTKIISENMNLLDGWSTSQLNAMLEKQNIAIATAIENGTRQAVPLIPRKNVVSMANIPLANNSQRLLQNEAYSRYFHDVEEIINNGIIDGLNADDITKQILDKVDMNANRARFWAEDQASIFQAEQTRLKAQREGYTHYRWKCQGNARPSHAVHKDQIYSWNVGVNNLTRPGARHPGEDYRCHCVADLATPEEIAKAGSQPPRAPQSTAGLIENYTGSEAKKASKGLTDNWAKKNLMNNYTQFEVDALTAWQSGYYTNIDSYLERETVTRTPGEIKALESRITSIDAAIDKSILPVELTVMSGIGDFAKLGSNFENIQIGRLIESKSYIPTTVSGNIAKSFTDSSKVIYEIVLPKGSKGVYMNNVSKWKPHEKEILLPRNAVYKVIDKYEKDGYKYIKMEIKE